MANLTTAELGIIRHAQQLFKCQHTDLLINIIYRLDSELTQAKGNPKEKKNGVEFMPLESAIMIVYDVAKDSLSRQADLQTDPYTVKVALDTVEDFIVNCLAEKED